MPKARIVRAVCITAIAGLVAVQVMRTGVAAALRSHQPALALKWNDRDALARERHATFLMQGQTEADAISLKQAAEEARRALARDPTSSESLSALALAQAALGDTRRTAALMTEAAKATRRDLGVQLWMIDAAVARDDAAGALVHFDNALRTQKAAPAILFPVLGEALSDSRLVAPIADVLAKRPPWRDAFLLSAFRNDAIDANFVAVLRRLERAGAPANDEVRIVTMDRLVARERYDLAWGLYRDFTKGRPGDLRDGNFRGTDRRIPYEWTFAADAELSAGIGSEGMEYVAGPSASGTLTSQALRLAPGSYRLTSSVSPQGEAPRWALECLPSRARPQQVNDARGRLDFIIPATACANQRLNLAIATGRGSEDRIGQVGNVRLARR